LLGARTSSRLGFRATCFAVISKSISTSSSASLGEAKGTFRAIRITDFRRARHTPPYTPRVGAPYLSLQSPPTPFAALLAPHSCMSCAADSTPLALLASPSIFCGSSPPHREPCTPPDVESTPRSLPAAPHAWVDANDDERSFDTEADTVRKGFAVRVVVRETISAARLLRSRPPLLPPTAPTGEARTAVRRRLSPALGVQSAPLTRARQAWSTQGSGSLLGSDSRAFASPRS